MTPVALERDSRTLKQAVSFSRLGYRSVVVEGERSGPFAAGLPIEVRPIEGAKPTWDLRAEISPGNAPGPAPAAVPRTNGRLGGLGRLALHPRRRFDSLSHFTDWNRRTYRALPDADLYVLHSYTQIPAVLRKGLGRRRARLAYDSHDAYFDMLQGRRAVGQGAWSVIERAFVKLAAGFSTVSEGLATVLEKRHGRRPVVLRNTHDSRLDATAAPGLREAAGLAPDDLLLVSVGNDKDGMAVEEALLALRELPPNVHFAWVGRGLERHAERIAELGLGGRAHLPGPAQPTEVASFIASADAALVLYKPVSANYVNALPNGFFQSVAADLPVLYPEHVPEIRALAERHSLGAPMDPADPESIGASVQALAADPQARARMRRNAAAAAEPLAWEKEEKVLARYVAGMLAGGRLEGAGGAPPP